jgi:tyrosyl-tRNA synthetase
MVKVNTNLYNELKERGLLYQCTDEDALKKMLESGSPITLYEGSDPTADSLHIGHCVPYCILRRFQKAGHKVLVLMGGATACIGDPSGKNEMRSMMTKEQINSNIEKIKHTLSVFLDFDGENPAIIVNNADWFKNINYIDFMRDVGVHFNVNKMLSSEIYKNRIENGGLTFFEMGYQLMQAYDFVTLNKQYGCTLQYGGADQWGNIAAGVELQRKLNFVQGTDVNLVGATNPLLLTPEGKKMGKTERGAIWIDKDKISAYDFYQGIYQTPDACVQMMFALFTDIPMKEINAMISEDIVKAKKTLCYEITKFVRGEEDAILAQKMSENLFAQGGNDAPEFEISAAEIDAGMGLLDLLVKTKLCSSKGEARKLIDNGGVTVKNEKVSDSTLVIARNDFDNDNSLLIKKGKKTFLKVVIK